MLQRSSSQIKLALSCNDKEMPEKVQAAPLVLWMADENGYVCGEQVVPEDGIQEELKKWRVETLLECEVPLASSVEG